MRSVEVRVPTLENASNCPAAFPHRQGIVFVSRSSVESAHGRQPRPCRDNAAFMRLKLTIEYAGTRYSGWQIQKNARTGQGEIERAVREAAGVREVRTYRSARP